LRGVSFWFSAGFKQDSPGFLGDPQGCPRQGPHSDHPTKANILWEVFKDRLGTTDNPDMLFNLEELLHRAEDLDFLTQPFFT
jgi:hypothetical protein